MYYRISILLASNKEAVDVGVNQYSLFIHQN